MHLTILLLLLSSTQGEEPVGTGSSPASVRKMPSNRASIGVLELQVYAFGQHHRLVLKETQLFHPQLQQYLVDAVEPGSPSCRVTSFPPKPLRGRWYLAQDNGPTALYVETYPDGRIKVEGIVTGSVRIAAVETASGWEHVAYLRPILKPHKNGHCPSNSPIAADSIGLDVRAIPPQVQPEVLLVLDYATSTHFQFNFEAAQKYLGVFYASVNQIFATINTPRIVNVITSVVMTKNSSVEWWVVRDKGSGLVDAAETLPAFGKWLSQQRNSFVSNYDVAVWNTGLDLGLLKDGIWSSEALGHAYIGSACHIEDSMNYNVALSEDKAGRFTGIRTHAHELAHLFGAAHDGQHVDNPTGNPGASRCPWNDGYVMSYQFGTKNNFYFSKCSANQIEYLLNNPRGSCLLNVAQRTTQVPFNHTLPGTFISLDEQCRSRHGQQYYFYQENANEVCLKLWCAKILDQQNAAITTSGPPLEGSPCATNKRCIRGDCI